jgi:hypothetical protein
MSGSSIALDTNIILYLLSADTDFPKVTELQFTKYQP